MKIISGKICALVKLIFLDKLDSDTRHPALKFDVPSCFGGWELGLLLPSLTFWVQLSVLMVILSLISQALAAFIFLFVVKNQGKVVAYITGYGVVIPLAIILPFTLVTCLDLRNSFIILFVASLPMLVGFRCMEAMHGTGPKEVESKLSSYCLYYSSMIEILFDEKGNGIKVNAKEIYKTVVSTTIPALIEIVMLLSILVPKSYKLVEERTTDSILDMFHWSRLLNNFSLAYLVASGLKVCSLILSFSTSMLSGFKTITVTDNAMLKCTSISDFWGRRWNQLIHGLLKRGIYKPIRRHYSPATAALGAFCASGIIHEYIVCLMEFRYANSLEDSNSSRNTHVLSTFVINYIFMSNHSQLWFFLWNGMLLLGEMKFRSSKIFQKIGKILPQRVQTFFILMTALPVAHWFLDVYIEHDFFLCIGVGFPRLIRLLE